VGGEGGGGRGGLLIGDFVVGRGGRRGIEGLRLIKAAACRFSGTALFDDGNDLYREEGKY
jgi:hypothetical protein